MTYPADGMQLRALATARGWKVYGGWYYSAIGYICRCDDWDTIRTTLETPSD